MAEKTRKRLWESIQKISVIQWIIAFVFAVLTWFVFLTCCKEIKNYQIFKNFRKKPAIFVLWHGRSFIFPPMGVLGGLRAYIVASELTDGHIMAKLQRLFGMHAIYGSSNQSSVSVLRKGVSMLRRGDYAMCISPDGPEGPSMRLQDGALYFAKMTGAPIIPVCFSTNHPCFQNRWDRYLLVYPFSKIKCEIGEPIYINSKISQGDFEKKRREIEKIMVDQLRRLDSEFNLYVVEQDLVAGKFNALKHAGKDTRMKKRYK